MCNRGSWRSFDAMWLQDQLCAIQQCTECGEHRAVVIEDAPVLGAGGADDRSGTDESPWSGDNSADSGEAEASESLRSSEDEGW